MMNKQLRELLPWEALLKEILWKQLGDIRNQRILDFGSGLGITANHFAMQNQVVAIEPDVESVDQRKQDFPYTQLLGSTEQLYAFPDASFDWILCHNVLEYAPDREAICKQFSRILKPDGTLSIVKHNRPGRVMQMVVLLNDFSHAHSLLDGKDGTASKYGTIHYYDDLDIPQWAPALTVTKTLGIRTFWDLQQNQEIHKDTAWQDKIVEIEMRVSELPEYTQIAFFHHLLLKKRSIPTPK